MSELAKRSGISRSYLFQIEDGRSSPTEAKIQALADAFGVLQSELLGEQSGEVNIPESLREFAEKENLGSAEIRMLAQIEYRGNKPASAAEWKAIFAVIRAIVE